MVSTTRGRPRSVSRSRSGSVWRRAPRPEAREGRRPARRSGERSRGRAGRNASAPARCLRETARPERGDPRPPCAVSRPRRARPEDGAALGRGRRLPLLEQREVGIHVDRDVLEAVDHLRQRGRRLPEASTIRFAALVVPFASIMRRSWARPRSRRETSRAPGGTGLGSDLDRALREEVARLDGDTEPVRLGDAEAGGTEEAGRVRPREGLHDLCGTAPFSAEGVQVVQRRARRPSPPRCRVEVLSSSLASVSRPSRTSLRARARGTSRGRG